MARRARPTLLAVALAVSASPAAWGQQPEPRLGYAFPAGAQRGAEVEVTLGGQHLDRPAAVLVTGAGVSVAVGRHREPVGGKKLQQLRQKLQQVRQAQREARREQPRGQRQRMRPLDDPELRDLIHGMGLDEVDVQAFFELRKRRNDPLGQINAQLSETVTVTVQVAADAPPGPRELRLVTQRGVSNPIRFVVGQLPEVRAGEPRGGEPEPLHATPVVVNGQVLPGDVDRFRFRGRAGARLVAAVEARGLTPYLADAVPGWFQATLTLYGPSGDEVAFSDDFRFHPDPTLGISLPADGDYVVEVKDALFRGREDFVYRLTLGEVPFLTGVYPLGGAADSPTAVTLTGWNLGGDQATVATGLPGVLEVTGAAGDLASNPAPFVRGALPEVHEREPNGEDAQAVALPQVVNGRIDAPGDLDLFRFRGAAGEVIVAEVVARRLQSPLDSLLVLTDAEGRMLAANDDHEDRAAGLLTHHADSRLELALPRDGTYLLRLTDAQRQGGPGHAYRLRISRRRPDFELRVVPSTVNLRVGQTRPITIHALRRDGFAGPIDLALVEPPPGLILSGGRIPAGADRVRATLTAARGVGDPTELRLEGRAEVDGQPLRRPAVPADDVMQAFLNRHLVAARAWVLAVQGRRRGWAPPRLLAPTPVGLPAGGVVELRFSVPPAPELAALKLALDAPPEGVAVGRVEHGPLGLSVRLTIDAGAAVGLEGNLILAASVERDLGERGRRAVPLGTLPAVPFRIEPAPATPARRAWFAPRATPVR